ncbi:MAG TPA: glycosyl transferase family 2 [Chitinophagaceae bacterium]|nr:glycosyl transferase family 2 [Chitinophagaceae bacterium]HAN38888.1 glycosyl transferase family 2 [Chitinophagaceae bacterium]
MQQWPSVAVVILNYNGKKFLEQFLPSVMASTYEHLQVVVADNASTDDSVSFLQRHYPSVSVLQLSENTGYAGGYNNALRQINSQYYILLNSDVAVTPHWIEPVIVRMEANQKIAAAQPKLLAFHEPDAFEYAGAAGGWIDVLGYPFSRGRIMDNTEKDAGQYNEAAPIFWASGAALFVRASAFHEVGGFDARFFAHQEEIDFCWRLQRAGYQVWCFPESVVYHVGGGTLPKGQRKLMLNFRNNLWMLCKHLPVREKIWKIPLRFALDGIFAWKSLLQGDASAWLAVVKAHLYIVCRFFSLGDGKGNWPKLPMYQYHGVALQWLIIAYFLRQKKRFSEIVAHK